MDPQDYFNEFVRPNLEEFRADPTNRRLAVNAAVSALHMADCVKERRGAPEVRTIVAQKCPQFNIVADVADAYKHTTITATRAGRVRDFTDFVKVERFVGTPSDYKSYPKDRDYFIDIPPTVTVSKSDDTLYDLMFCLEKVVDYWQDYLATGRL